MLIWTARLSRKKAALAVIAAGALVIALLLFLGRSPGEEAAAPQLLTNEDRVAYLQSMGWEIGPEPLETLQFLLPGELTEPYLTYNELQNAQGFDLARCCGKQVSRYTYAVSNYPGRPDGVQVNLYVCGGEPVAGDVCCPGADGFQVSLVYPRTE